MKQQIEKPVNALPDSGDNTKKAPVMKEEKKERNYAWGIFVGLCLVVAVIMIIGL